MKKHQANFQQLSLSIDKPISALLKDLRMSRNPLVIDATKKLEEGLHLLQYVQDKGVVKSKTAKIAIYELLSKF
ncbi:MULTISPECIES: hypothetical protein [Calothrix]|uniref:Uncharacterized protein n=2 Tax=Calothrix TaxID=1186 RepID=A0ABR8AL11_9CYAN|nr:MULTISPECIES: hypothetical protein [Calothrix]MBD2200718.1 hypothetical protein [Calothrix parietina FACHB-288]MBD2229760.1 hypothetical protein [Calothrix anomala FACHB-343]